MEEREGGEREGRKEEGRREGGRKEDDERQQMMDICLASDQTHTQGGRDSDDRDGTLHGD